MNIYKIIKEPWHIATYMNSHGLGSLIPDKLYLKCAFRERMGYPLDLRNPRTFNEKIQWLKLYDRNPLYHTLVDKYEVKRYVAEIIGSEHIIPTLGVWDSFDDIDFDMLPNRFVLKCTHDSGSIVIVKDKGKFHVDDARDKLEKALKTNYYMLSREWVYKHVRPRIIAEEYMEDNKQGDLRDYKVFNFNGIPSIIQVDFDRFVSHKRNLYSKDWDYIEASIEYPNDPATEIHRPKSLEKMLELAEKLSEKIPFVRTDFYLIDDRVFFGEMTFYHESGFAMFTPDSLGIELGKKIYLKGKNQSHSV